MRKRADPRDATEVAAQAKARRSEDRDDLANAQKDSSGRSTDKPWYKSIGPGLITGAADDDPSGIGTYSQSGASFGLGQLWLVPFCIPLMIAVQEMCGRALVQPLRLDECNSDGARIELLCLGRFVGALKLMFCFFPVSFPVPLAQDQVASTPVPGPDAQARASTSSICRRAGSGLTSATVGSAMETSRLWRGTTSIKSARIYRRRLTSNAS